MRVYKVDIHPLENEAILLFRADEYQPYKPSSTFINSKGCLVFVCMCGDAGTKQMLEMSLLSKLDLPLQLYTRTFVFTRYTGIK